MSKYKGKMLEMSEVPVGSLVTWKWRDDFMLSSDPSFQLWLIVSSRPASRGVQLVTMVDGRVASLDAITWNMVEILDIQEMDS